MLAPILASSASANLIHPWRVSIWPLIFFSACFVSSGIEPTVGLGGTIIMDLKMGFSMVDSLELLLSEVTSSMDSVAQALHVGCTLNPIRFVRNWVVIMHLESFSFLFHPLSLQPASVHHNPTTLNTLPLASYIAHRSISHVCDTLPFILHIWCMVFCALWSAQG